MKLSDFPNELPAVTLDFQNSRQLDPRISFSRASDATTTPPTTGEGSGNVGGSLYQFPENVPRLTDQGLLIEPSRTNSLQQSQSLATTPWTYSNNTGDGAPTVTNNSGTAPDGTNTATRIDYVAISGGYQNWIQTVDPVTAEGWTFSFWVKAATSADGGKTVRFQIFKTGTTVNQVPHTLTNEWVRLDVTKTFASGVTGGCQCQIEQMPGQGAMSCLVWGAQCEAGSFLTTHPNRRLLLTRAQDICYIDGDDFSFYNPNKNTIIWKQKQ